jgi:hypothetical protein
LTGPEALSCYEVADIILSQILNRRITYVDITGDAAGQGMKQMGMTDMLIDALLDLYRITRYEVLLSGSQMQSKKRQANTVAFFLSLSLQTTIPVS